ncbi:MAG: hypothetical protein MN733_31855 [Nitrososphaera sp.]|nr:hypothetical protein [Nitrososphaera sp.]
MPNAVLSRIDKFCKTPLAISLGIDSRPSFFIMLTTAFLEKYDAEYANAAKLFDITEADLNGILQRIKAKALS